MAKEPPATKPEDETPFQRFQRLAKKIIAVPKEKTQEMEKGKPQSL